MPRHLRICATATMNAYYAPIFLRRPSGPIPVGRPQLVSSAKTPFSSPSTRGVICLVTEHPHAFATDMRALRQQCIGSSISNLTAYLDFAWRLRRHCSYRQACSRKALLQSMPSLHLALLQSMLRFHLALLQSHRAHRSQWCCHRGRLPL